MDGGRLEGLQGLEGLCGGLVVVVAIKMTLHMTLRERKECLTNWIRCDMM